MNLIDRHLNRDVTPHKYNNESDASQEQIVQFDTPPSDNGKQQSEVKA